MVTTCTYFNTYCDTQCENLPTPLASLVWFCFCPEIKYCHVQSHYRLKRLLCFGVIKCISGNKSSHTGLKCWTSSITTAFLLFRGFTQLLLFLAICFGLRARFCDGIRGR